MYGTVARFQAKPGAEKQLTALLNQFEWHQVPGFVAEYIYRLDSEPDTYFMVALFENKETYFANADSPEQDARYRQFRALLVDDPEWHDGEVVYAGSVDQF